MTKPDSFEFYWGDIKEKNRRKWKVICAKEGISQSADIRRYIRQRIGKKKIAS